MPASVEGHYHTFIDPQLKVQAQAQVQVRYLYLLASTYLLNDLARRTLETGTQVSNNYSTDPRPLDHQLEAVIYIYLPVSASREALSTLDP